jgi:DNA-binding transcriptional LysR family regulator
MQVRYLELLHAILLTGSVSGAARALGLSQPAASRMLAAAERAFGFALFERRSGRLVPTPEAEALEPEAARVMAGLDAARRLGAALRVGKGTVLRVAATPALALDVLPRAVAALRRANPSLGCDLATLHGPEIARALLARERDIGFALDPAPHPALLAQPLTQAPLVAIFPAGEEPVSATLAALPAARLIGLPEDDPLGRLLAGAGPAGTSGVRVQTYHLALSLVARGAGIAVVDPFTAALGLDRCRAVPLEPAMTVTLTALTARHGRAPAAARQLSKRVTAAATDIATELSRALAAKSPDSAISARLASKKG